MAKIKNIQIPINGDLLSLDLNTYVELNESGKIPMELIELIELSEYQPTNQKGQPYGYASLDGSGKVPSSEININLNAYQLINQKGQAYGYASLDGSGKVPSGQTNIDLSGYLLKSENNGITKNFILSELINKGDFVQLLDDGEVETIKKPITIYDRNIVNSSLIESRIKLDPYNENKFIIAFNKSGSQYGVMRVGEISGGTVSLGDEYVFKNASCALVDVQYDPFNQNKFIVQYYSPWNINAYYYLLAGEISGTSISFGSPYQNIKNGVYRGCFQFDPFNQNKFIVCYSNPGSGDGYGEAMVGTLSGTTIISGETYTFSSGGTYGISIQFDPFNPNKFLIAYGYDINGSSGGIKIGEISGSTIIFSDRYTFAPDTYVNEIFLDFDPFNQNKFMVNYSAGSVKIGEISGTTMAFGEQYEIPNGHSSATIKFDRFNKNKFIVIYYMSTWFENKNLLIMGDVFGRVITFDEDMYSVGINLSDRKSSLEFDMFNENKIVISNMDKIQIAEMVKSNLNTSKLLGISLQDGVSGETKNILLLGGIYNNLSGLTTNSYYHIKDNGVISTTPNSTSILIGKALSPTSLLTKNQIL